jgi:peptidoglycan hydrolase CwlO-like protein
MLTTVSIAAATVVSLIAILATLWKIAKSVTTTQVAVTEIEKDILEIKIILDKTDARIDKVCEKATLNEYRIKTVEGDIKEIRDNCKEIQIQHRQERLG